MELRNLRCLAAALVALDKPNASQKIPFSPLDREDGIRNKPFALFTCICYTWQARIFLKKPLFYLWTSMEIGDLRCLAAAFVALDKPNASKKSPFSPLDGEDGFGNKPFALFACVCNT